jgi:hypothetical protein
MVLAAEDLQSICAKRLATLPPFRREANQPARLNYRRNRLWVRSAESPAKSYHFESKIRVESVGTFG